MQNDFRNIRKKRLISQSSSFESIMSPNLVQLKEDNRRESTKGSDRRLNKYFGDTHKSFIGNEDYDLDNENDVSLLLLLSMMCEIFVFHSLLILQKEDAKCEDLYRNEFLNLIQKDNSLPIDFWTDLLIKHKLKSDACKFLFIKNDFERLMEYIQDFYETTNNEMWLQKYAKYIKKIRELNINNLRFSHNFVLKYIPWLFDKKWEDIAMDCLKHFNDVPPVYSRKIIDVIKHKGSPELCRKYLEYLTLTYNVSDPKYHTELAISYINEIIAVVNQKY